jgi:MFS family permease
VAGGSVLLTLQNGLIMAAFGAYLVAITADTGWAAGVIAVAYAIVQLGNGFLSPFTGWCCDRFGTRVVTRVGTVAMAAGFALASTTEVASHFVAAVVMIALGCSAAGMTPLTVAVVQSVTQRRTLALGLLPTGIALGGLAVPLVALALAGLGWRATFLVVAGVIAVVGLIASTALPARRVPRPEAGVPRAGPDHGLSTAMRTSAFWLLVLGHGSALVAISAVSLHLVPLLTHHHGFSLTVSGVAVAVMSVAQLLGQVVTGLVADRLDKRWLAAGCMVVHTAVLLALAVGSGLVLIVVAVVVHGLAWGLRGPVMASLRADYFGTGAFGAIMGWSMGFVSLGLVLGPLLATALAEGAGGYPAAFGTIAAITAAGTFAFLVVRQPAHRAPSGEESVGR